MPGLCIDARPARTDRTVSNGTRVLMPAILLDSCVWGGAVPALAERGHDVVWSGAWPSDPGDIAILAAAYDARRILVTLDKDFGELVILKGQPIRALFGWQASVWEKWRTRSTGW
jgi:hypothetical protein